jgi:hypothetical protein
MPEPTIAQAQAVIHVIALHNVAMRQLLAELNELEKPIRAEFERAKKPHFDRYQIACKELAIMKEARLAEITQEGNQDA